MKAIIVFACAVVALSAGAVEMEAVDYEFNDVVYRGVLAVDPSIEGVRPLVLVVHEWWGLTQHARNAAEKLARAGYAGFAVDMYGDAQNTGDADQAAAWAAPLRQNPKRARDILQAALSAVEGHEAIKAGPVACIGFCFGGTVSLEMARLGWAPLGAAVSFHGGLGSSVPEGDRALKAAVLVHHGAADTMVPQADVDALQQELAQAGIDWQLNVYEDAKHSFTNPEADDYGMEGVGYNAAAAERSWAATETFLDRVLGSK